MTATQIEWTDPVALLYPKQYQAIYAPRRIAVIEASTKSGKTTGCLLWLADQAITHGRGVYWWVAPTFSQAKIAFRRLRFFLLPAIERGLCRLNAADLTMTLWNEALLQFKSGDRPDTLYGEDVRAAVIDEASRLREDVWHAVRSTLTATRGPIRIIGNVKGRRNWFYALARRAEAGDPDMAYARLVAADAVAAGVLPPQEIEQARRHLPEHIFRELYLAEPSDDGANPFGLAHIAACVTRDLAPTEPVVWGWDLARAQDYTVGIALDRDGTVCRFHRFQKPWEETLATILTETGATAAVVDATGVGDPIVERLQRQGAWVLPYRFTRRTRQQLLENLAVAIQRHELRFPDGPIRAELEAFEYVTDAHGVRYAAPAGVHDDCVMALGLAVWGWRRHSASWDTAYAIVTCSRCGHRYPNFDGTRPCPRCGKEP